MMWLKNSCHVVPFSKITHHTLQEMLNRPVVSVTLDDGYMDNYEYAYPILLELGLPFTVFVTVGLVELQEDVVAHFMNGLRWRRTFEQIRPLDYRALREIVSHGGEVGVHGYTHKSLASLGYEGAKEELILARRRLEESLGVEVRDIAYPFGRPGIDVTREVVTAAREVGFDRGATTVARGVRVNDSPYLLPRFIITDTPIEVLKAKIMGALDILEYLRRC
jgi:peptidoglycan/xylan/chitin deacetylase (PgdA/CDA1 family)